MEEYKKSHGRKFKISGPKWDEEFELPDESSLSGIYNYFEYIIKKHEILTDNPPVRVYIHRV